MWFWGPDLWARIVRGAMQGIRGGDGVITPSFVGLGFPFHFWFNIKSSGAKMATQPIPNWWTNMEQFY